MRDEFLTLLEAGELTGMSPRALADRTRRGLLPRYRDPRDRRRLLIARHDVELFLRPLVITDEQGRNDTQPIADSYAA